MSAISNTRLIISILQQIPRYPGLISVNELREKILESEGLDIPIRNMQRYLSQVKGHFGLNCSDTDSGNAKMWFVEHIERRDPKRNHMPTTQAISYLMAQQLLEGVAPKAISKQLEPIFKQAQDSLSTKGKGFACWNKKIKVIQDGLPIIKQSITQEVIDTAVESMLMETQIEIVYKPKHAAHPTKYIVSPLGVIVKGSSQYLVCIDERSLSKKPKHFLLNDICECKNTNNNIDKDYLVGNKAFDLDEYCQKESLETVYDSENITLIAEIKPKVWQSLQDSPISDDQRLDSKVDGDCENKILSATIPFSYELTRWILSHADNITVLEPKALREKIQESCVSAANNYRVLSDEELKRLG